jgi:inositol-phosphate phosphatase/L-galactose 1-phosphate phosphatase/histidinol-phosphatase
MSIPTEFVSFIHDLAEVSAKVIVPFYGQPVAVEVKKDVSPVTMADKNAEAAMRDVINSRYPMHGIWGEEYGAERLDAEWVWVLDPVDGTKAFSSGLLTFGTLIALMHNGVPVVGVINQPIVKDRWLGINGQPTTRNGKPIRTRACNDLSLAVMRGCEPREFRLLGEYDCFAQLASQTRYEDALWGGDCLNYGVLAGGYIDLVVEATMKLHDFAPMQPIIEGAGGVISDWQGRPLTMQSDGHVIAAGSRVLLDKAVAILGAA